MTRFVTLFVLAFAGVAWADPGITLPPTLTLEPGRLAKIEATTIGKTVRWVNPDPVNMDLIASESGRWIIVAAPKPGIYRVAAFTTIVVVDAENRLVSVELPEAAVCVITVAGPKPPEPPVPPVPPVPPQPVDLLARELRALYANDPAPAELKRQAAQQLALFYRAAALIVTDGRILTVGSLVDSLSEKAPTLGNTLEEVKRRVTPEAVSLFGLSRATQLTVNHRGAGAAFFNRLAAIMEGINQ